MKEIIADIETMVEFCYKHFTEDPEVDIAANRVKEWLEIFKDEEKYDGLNPKDL